MFHIPVLLIIYKRKQTTQTLLEQLRLIRPAQLFIAADGPKTDADILKCEETRSLIDNIDWDCTISKLYHDKNLGVSLGPKTAIDWFFEHNEMGIIFEDDILPALDFFPFCEKLLWRYKDEPKVMHISAMNFFYGKQIVNYSYYFSKVISPWGWASWRRAWQHFDYDLMDLDQYVEKLGLPQFYQNELYRCKNEPVKFAWDYQWLYSVLKNNGVGIVPSKNLALNIGFGDSTDPSNTFGIPHWAKKMKLERITSIIHPPKIIYDKFADDYTFKEIIPNYKMSFWNTIRYLTKKAVY